MSALAQLLKARGHTVSGSDRSLDRGQNKTLFEGLSRLGINCLPQNGSGLENGIDIAVVSSAIEETNPDIRMARAKAIPIVNRAALLAVLFNQVRGVGVAGTNGKTTVTGMVGWILDRAGLDPTVVAGGMMKNYSDSTVLGNTRLGRSDIMTIEADESDGSIVYYKPHVGVVMNVTKDHKPINELCRLFSIFAENSSKLVLGADCPMACKMGTSSKETATFGLEKGADFRVTDTVFKEWSSTFRVRDVHFELNLPGRHNVLNALAAVATCHHLSVPLGVAAEALRDYRGIRRRLDLVGEVRDVKVIDDFAHNPQKIRATIETVRPISSRILVIYQPHGFTPTRFLKEELVQTFSEILSGSDMLFMPEIFYAGGTTKKDISSRDIVEALISKRARAEFIPERPEIIERVLLEARPGDVVLVMGARDDTLTDFCHNIIDSLADVKAKAPPARHD